MPLPWISSSVGTLEKFCKAATRRQDSIYELLKYYINGDSCKFHAGGPIFHDALKGWSCCKKRTTDFTEFLNIPGCTKGPHSNEKPPEPNSNKSDSGDVQQVTQEILITASKPLERPSDSEPMVKLKFTVGATLQQVLEKKLQEMTIKKTEESIDDCQVKKGTVCKNPTCTMSYEDETSNLQSCTYHSGAPVFHEGMKYWSCCKRKTSDFNAWLNQEGCTTGKHLWIQKEREEKKVACRYDWHQTGSNVIISIFSKVALPDKTSVEANKVSCRINIVFDAGESQFNKDLVLKGIIDPERSSVKMLGTKVEITLRKVEPGSWSSLEAA